MGRMAQVLVPGVPSGKGGSGEFRARPETTSDSRSAGEQKAQWLGEAGEVTTDPVDGPPFANDTTLGGLQADTIGIVIVAP